MRLRRLIESPSTAVFAFGRMNPPTLGHRKLADKVKSLEGTPFLFLTHSQKPKTDPLSFAEKVFFAQKSFGFPGFLSRRQWCHEEIQKTKGRAGRGVLMSKQVIF